MFVLYRKLYRKKSTLIESYPSIVSTTVTKSHTSREPCQQTATPADSHTNRQPH